MLHQTITAFDPLDSLALDDQLTGDERLVRDTAEAYAQDKLLPRVTRAFLDERFDREILHEMGELGLLGVKGFLFHEGANPIAGRAFGELARLTGGAYARFDASAPQSLAGLLRAAAAYASGGTGALARLAAGDSEARKLLTAMGKA